MNTVTLTNGHDVPEVLVMATLLNLSLVRDQEPVAFFELVSAAHDRNHKVFAEPLALALKDRYSLIDQIRQDRTVGMSDAVRHIITAATNPDPMKMEIKSPVAGA
jgi:hypothetical protein